MAKLTLNNNSNKNSENNENQQRLKIGQNMKIRKTNDEREKYRNKCMEIEQELIQDMEDSSINIEVNEEDRLKSDKKYRSLKIKKLVLYFFAILLIISINIFAIYKTFFKHEFTGKEIAILANYYNGVTNFPEDGVQGFISSNIDKIVGEKLTMNSGVQDLNINNPTITRINPKNNELANVYFYVFTNTNNGEQRINCVVPIFWDKENNQYRLGGEVMLTPNKPTNNNTDIKKNYLLSFKDISTEDSDKTKSSESFVNNFFTLLYSGQDISQYYNGDVELIGSENNDLKYNGISSYVLYKDKNQNGYNAYCKINLSTSNGLNYTTEKYICIEGKDKNWIITAVL